MKTIITFSFLLCVAFLVGCSKNDELSRDTAEKLIRERLHLPDDVIIKFAIEDRSMTQWMTKDRLEILAREGLVTYRNDDRLFSGGVYGELTEKGKQFVVSDKYDDGRGMQQMFINVKAAKVDFGTITGIVEQKELNIAEVNYTLIQKDVNAFGRSEKMQEGILDKRATFRKYDDGWRIE